MKKILLFLITITTLITLVGCVDKTNTNDEITVDPSTEDVNPDTDEPSEQEVVFIYEEISDFLENDLKSIIAASTYVDYNIAAAFSLLNANGYAIDLNDYVTDAQKELYENYDFNQEVTGYDSKEGNGFKALVVQRALGMDLTNATDFFTNIDSVTPYAEVSALHSFNILGIDSNARDEVITTLKYSTYSEYLDADYSAMVLAALQEATPQTFIDLLESFITVDGVENWELNPSCASTAQTIIGLSTITGDLSTYAVDGVSLESMLLSFACDGGFEDIKGDGLDIYFATPQAFAALACLEVNAKTNSQVVLFSA